MFHVSFMTIPTCFVHTLWHYYAYSVTNLLRCFRRDSSYFARKHPEHPRAARGGPHRPQMIGRRGPGPGRAALWCRRPFDPPAPPLRLYKASVAKTLKRRTTRRKTFQSRHHREAKIWGTELCSGTLPVRGSAPGRLLHRHRCHLHRHLHHRCCSHEEGVVLHRGSGLYR